MKKWILKTYRQGLSASSVSAFGIFVADFFTLKHQAFFLNGRQTPLNIVMESFNLDLKIAKIPCNSPSEVEEVYILWNWMNFSHLRYI